LIIGRELVKEGKARKGVYESLPTPSFFVCGQNSYRHRGVSFLAFIPIALNAGLMKPRKGFTGIADEKKLGVGKFMKGVDLFS